jgi:outer membrane protein
MRTVLLVMGILGASCACAQEQNSSAGSGWTGTLGAAPLVTPKYVGGKSQQVLPVPIAYVAYNDWFYVNLFRAGAYVWGSADRKMAFGFAVEPRLGYHASDGAKLSGMATRKDSLSGGPTFDMQGDWGALSVGYFSDLTGSSHGGYLDVLFDRPLLKSNGWDVSATFEVTRLDSKVVNYYFGVTPAEATASRPAYLPGATTNVTFWITGQYNLSKRYAVMFGGNITRLGSAAADSPIVETRLAPLAYLGLGINL